MFAAFVAWGAVSGGLAGDTWMGGWHVEALMFAALESALAVFGPVWLLGVAQQRLDRPLRWAGPAVGRSAYGAFIVQRLVLIGLAVALRPLSLTAEAKALVVAVGGVTGSFWLAWLLISRVPISRGFRRDSTNAGRTGSALAQVQECVVDRVQRTQVVARVARPVDATVTVVVSVVHPAVIERRQGQEVLTDERI